MSGAIHPAHQKDLRDIGRETLLGHVLRVIYHNPENGYTVLSLLPDGGAGDAVSCVGRMLNPLAGVQLELCGKFVVSQRYGRQFSFESAVEKLPVTLEGIRLYLSSGLIRGIGEAMASRIVDVFGEKTLEILDEDPQRLLKVPGLGKKSLERIRASWAEHRGMRDLLLFVRPHGVSPALAVRIYRAYGADAVPILRENPYRLAMDISGIGFSTADSVAMALGFDERHPLRVRAACLYQLQQSSERGDCYLPEDELSDLVCGQIDCGPDEVRQALDALMEEGRLVRETDSGGECGLYLARLHHYESKTAFYLARIMRTPKLIGFAHLEDACEMAARGLGISLASAQREAVIMAGRHKVMVLTGGPGTGKTTIINAVIRLFATAKARILLAAPTGRAAKRMSEACGHEARTIHRLLEFSPKEGCFARNENRPLACGLLVVDEASMMDSMLFYHLLKAVPLGATLLLVGDIHQLPSVGPGNVLADIIASGACPVAKLTEIFRQSAESSIISNAHAINNGRMPSLESSPSRLSDFYFIAQDDPDKAAEMVVELVSRHIPRRFGLDPLKDVQVLSPMHKGSLGAARLNELLRQRLNPSGREARKGDRAFRLRDRVMQCRNNYDKDVFNGDLGRVAHVDFDERMLSVDFDGRKVPYAFEELDELVPAYAISIHKSQGSEYPAVVIPIMMQHYVLLQRNLIYTGVTRGRRLVVLVGEVRALHTAVKNAAMRRRRTRLAAKLAEALL